MRYIIIGIAFDKLEKETYGDLVSTEKKELYTIETYNKDGFESKHLVSNIDGSRAGLVLKKSKTNDAKIFDKYGIMPQGAHPNAEYCSIGFSEKEQKWYGWSHRAMFGFGIGDTMYNSKKIIRNLKQAKESAIKFADSVS